MPPGVNPAPAQAARRNRNNEAIRAYRRIAAGLLESARTKTEASRDLNDKESYAALCLAFTGLTWDIRVLRDMLMFLGRIHGHDQQRAIVLEDPSSYHALIDALRAQQAKMIDAPPAPPREENVIDVDTASFEGLREELNGSDADRVDAAGDPNER